MHTIQNSFGAKLSTKVSVSHPKNVVSETNNFGEEEEEGAPPERVRGVGDEAFWTGSRIGGTLYVLKGNSYLRISIGGAADQPTKMKRSKVLAQKAVARL